MRVVEFSLPAADFELGRILAVDSDTVIELETLVPLGDQTVPLFWIHDPSTEPFVEAVTQHSNVFTATEIDSLEDRTLFRLNWDSNTDDLITGIKKWDGQVLNAVGRTTNWEFELRFSTHQGLSSFSNHCDERDLNLTINRVYTPTEHGTLTDEGMSDLQLEAFTLAIKKGYYEIPRGCSTRDIADELGISDQAVTERLRRAIVSLSRVTLSTPNED